jgi:hypothetical protein
MRLAKMFLIFVGSFKLIVPLFITGRRSIQEWILSFYERIKSLRGRTLYSSAKAGGLDHY